jgi:tetratricopeptide (TPR) repeat protein
MHLPINLQEYVSAIKLYQKVLTKNRSNKDAGVLLYLARAYYDSENLLEAKRTLLRAIHVAPTGAPHPRNPFPLFAPLIHSLFHY